MYEMIVRVAHKHELAVIRESMIQRLFVYGTLALGRPNEHVLRKIGGTWEAVLENV